MTCGEKKTWLRRNRQPNLKEADKVREEITKFPV